jgi:glycosyltransferase involved in cell wall biosynthesis
MLILDILKMQRSISRDNPKSFVSAKSLKLFENKILFVGMVDSPHFQKWLSVYCDEFPMMKVFVFPSDRPRQKRLLFSETSNDKKRYSEFSLSRSRKLNFCLFLGFDKLLGKKWRAYCLGKLILKERPKLIHFHETQHGAYIYNLISNSRDIPTNIYKILSTWGSDLILYSQFKSHQSNLEVTLSWVDLLTAERFADLEVAKTFNFKGRFEFPIYITVGTESSGPKGNRPSKRKVVLIKGYQDLPGRALSALEAVSLLSEQLENYSLRIYSASGIVQRRAKELNRDHGLDILCLKRISRKEMDKMFSEARIAISLAISDGLPGSLVEAMKGGAFPIQSRNSAGLDFLENGVTGFLVDPEDINEIKMSMKIALENDHLVDSAYPKSLKVLEEKYSLKLGKEKLKNIYLDRNSS